MWASSRVGSLRPMANSVMTMMMNGSASPTPLAAHFGHHDLEERNVTTDCSDPSSSAAVTPMATDCNRPISEAASAPTSTRLNDCGPIAADRRPDDHHQADGERREHHRRRGQSLRRAAGERQRLFVLGERAWRDRCG